MRITALRVPAIGTVLLGSATLAAVELRDGGDLPWTGTPWLARAMGDLASSVLALGGLVAAAIVFAILRLMAGRRRSDPNAPPPVSNQVPVPRRQTVFMALLAIGVLVLPFAIFWPLRRIRGGADLAVPPAMASPLAGQESPTVRTTAPAPSAPVATPAGPGWWPVVITLAAVAVAVLLVVVISRSRRRRLGLLGSESRRAATTASASTDEPRLSAVQIPADPRAAILACYLLMESALAGRGVLRRPGETPSELARRAAYLVNRAAGPAAGHTVAVSGGRLCLLYDEARFSDHPLPISSRRDALAALAELDDALREAR